MCPRACKNQLQEKILPASSCAAGVGGGAGWGRPWPRSSPWSWRRGLSEEEVSRLETPAPSLALGLPADSAERRLGGTVRASDIPGGQTVRALRPRACAYTPHHPSPFVKI